MQHKTVSKMLHQSYAFFSHSQLQTNDMTDDINTNDKVKALAGELESQLMQLYGSPLLAGEDLRAALGFRSLDALRQAIARNTMPVPLITMQNRRGKYALVKDIACYLASLRCQQT